MSSKNNIVMSDDSSDDDIPLSKKMKLIAEDNIETTSASVSTSSSKKSKNSDSKAKSSKTPKKKKSSEDSDEDDDDSEVFEEDEDIPLARMIKTKVTVAKKDNTNTDTEVVGKKNNKKVVSKKEKKQEKEKDHEADDLIKKEDEDKDKGDNEEESESDEEYKWWENPTWDDTIKWETLEHNGVFFPPEYVSHGVKMIYNGQEIQLEPEAEEVAGFFAALIETDYSKNPTFVKNFFEDFQATLKKINSAYCSMIKDFNKCDFTPMFKYFEVLKAAKKAMTKEEKAKIKDEKKELDDHYGMCVLDGRKEKVGNYRIEPPGLFRGRGQHPKTGKLKFRVRPEDITINIGKTGLVPIPPPGHQWKDVINNNTVTWLATWTENINGVPKYVQLGATSSLKGKSDYKKFETARRLKHHIASIRAKNAEELRSKEMAVRQRATALWLIDHLAIRAGNEKGDDEADTVGCCSLRLEHVQLNTQTSEVTFDFLGKDSIRYLNTVAVDPIIVKNLAIFMRPPKVQTDMIFDRLDTSMLNAYLTSLMPGLTAKVFRTFNASTTMQKELDKVEESVEASVAEKILGYNRANREVAVLCNHQRAVPKSHDQSMGKLQEKISHLKYSRLLLKRKMRELVTKKEFAKYNIDEDESDLDEEAEKRIIAEIDAIEIEKYRKKLEKEGKEMDPDYKPPKQSPGKTATASLEVLQKRLEALSTRIQAARHNATDREENKTTSLGTSKINYIDPRITSAWCQIHSVPIERMFTKTLRDKFKWAMDVPKEWRF